MTLNRQPTGSCRPHRAARAILRAAAAGDWTAFWQRLAESEALGRGPAEASSLDAERMELLAAVVADLRQLEFRSALEPAGLARLRVPFALLAHLATSPDADQPALRPT